MTATLTADFGTAVDSPYKTLSVGIAGIDSVLMHNGLLASPLNPVTKAMKSITAKRNKKTERDVEMLSELEIVGGLYISRLDRDGNPMAQATVQVEMGEIDFTFGITAVDADGNEQPDAPLEAIRGNQIVMPGLNIEAMLVKGAKKSRLGTDFKTGVMVPGDYRLRHKHEQRSIQSLISEPDFIDSRLVVVDRKRIVRTRPQLKQWSLDFMIQYLPSVVSASQIQKALDDASLYIGMGDFTPRFGKFSVTKFEELS